MAFKLCCVLIGLALLQMMMLIVLSKTFKTHLTFTFRHWLQHYSDHNPTIINKKELITITKIVNNKTATNPLYKHFNISSVNELQRVDILFLVTSAPGRFNRRSAIRSTWWKECLPTKHKTPGCFFITDDVTNASKYNTMLTHEAKVHKDILFQPLSGGVRFGQRYLYHLLYVYKHFHFDYFVRMDDDMFFCMTEFLHQLPLQPQLQVHWGWVHCEYGITRPEESIILFSYDIVSLLLSQDPNNMLCHPFADQMVAIWLKTLKLGQILRHDDRIHHDPVVSETPRLQGRRHICRDYLAVHGSSATDIRTFWKYKGRPKLNVKDNIFDMASKCQGKFSFEWKNLGFWKHIPKRCINNPIWITDRYEIKNGMYTGRLGNGNISRNNETENIPQNDDK